MIFHYIKMAVRQLLKYKFHTIVSALCMAIGLTVNGYLGTGIKLNSEQCGVIDITRSGVTPADNNWPTGIEYKQLVEKNIEGIEQMKCSSEYKKGAVAYTEDDAESKYEVYIKAVSHDYFRYSKTQAGRSVFSGLRDSIGEGEVVVSSGFAKRAFGKDKAIGKSLTLVSDSIHAANDYTGKSYRIIGVAEPLYPKDVTSWVYVPMLYNEDIMVVSARITDGYSVKEIKENLDKVEWKASKDGAPIKYRIGAHNSGATYVISVILITIFSLLIFVTGLINFMKFMIQMFYARNRELALRKCLGSSDKGLYMLLACEVVVMLGVSFLLSCITSELSIYYCKYMNLTDSLGMVLTMPQLLTTQFTTTLIAMGISLLIILLPVLKLRRAALKGAMMRQRQGTKGRNFMIGVQFAVSILFFILLGFVLGVNKYERNHYSDILTKSEQEKIIVMHKTVRSWEDIRQQLEKLPEVESTLYCNAFLTSNNVYYGYHKCHIGEDSCYVKIVASGDPRYFEFFNIEMQGNVVTPEDKNYVYIGRKLHNKLAKDKNFDGTLTIEGKKHRVAGTIEYDFIDSKQYVYVDHEGPRLVEDAIFLPESDYRVFFYRIKDGVSTEEAKKAFTEACHKYIPTTFDIKINSFKDIIYESEKGNRFLLHACYLLTFISLLVVVLSIYSSISLDATTRQKEISLRKINGAHRKDIFKHFVSPYIITYTVTFIIIYPQLAEFISWQVDNAHNYDEIFSTGRMIVYAILVFVVTIALLAVTSWHKIRMIMNINPADVIRKE